MKHVRTVEVVTDYSTHLRATVYTDKKRTFNIYTLPLGAKQYISQAHTVTVEAKEGELFINFYEV